MLYGAGAYYLERRCTSRPLCRLGRGSQPIIIVAAVMFLRRHEARLQSEAERASGPLMPLLNN